MTRTINQKIAEAEKKLAGLREKARAKDTRQKIIVGGLMIDQALKLASAARVLIDAIERAQLRESDKMALADLLGQLGEVAERGN